MHHALRAGRPPASPTRLSPRKSQVGGALTCSSLSPCSSKASLSDISAFVGAGRLSYASTHTEWDERRASMSPRKAKPDHRGAAATEKRDSEPAPAPATPPKVQDRTNPDQPTSSEWASPVEQTVRRMTASPESRLGEAPAEGAVMAAFVLDRSATAEAPHSDISTGAP